MKCNEIQELLLRDTESLSSAEKNMIEIHLKSCVNCKHFAQLTQLENKVLAEPIPLFNIPPDFIASTIQKLPKDLYPLKENYNQDNIIVLKETKRKIPWSHLGIAASLLLFFGTGFYFHDDLGNLFFGSDNATIVAESSTVNETVKTESAGSTELSEKTESKEETAEENINVTAIPDENITETQVKSSNTVSVKSEYKDPAPETNEQAETILPPKFNQQPSVNVSYGASLASGIVNSTDSSSITLDMGSAPETTAPNIVLSPIPPNYSLVNVEGNDNAYKFEYTDDMNPDRQIICEAQLYDSDAENTPSSASQMENTETRLIQNGDLVYEVTISCTDNHENLGAILDRIDDNK